MDAYPRYVEDVMDLVIFGISRITIRNMKEEMIKEVSNIVEKDVYLSYNNASDAVNLTKKYGFKGVVLNEWQQVGEDIETWKLYMKEYVIRRVK